MQGVVVVDPFSSGLCLAQLAMERGFACIAVFSDAEDNLQDLLGHLPLAVRRSFAAAIFREPTMTLDQLVSTVRSVGFEIVGVLAGAEPGVCLADALSEAFGVRTNGSAGSAARRNKYVMGETIRAAGLRAIKQCQALSWSDAERFLLKEFPSSSFDAILKPLESAGSDDVFLVHSMAEAKAAFDTIVGKVNHLRLTNTSCLVQEYLAGSEYVVDTVSRDGNHKVIAVWEYDKRPINGAAFVYFGVWLRPVTCHKTLALVKYALQVLDAVGIRNGPGHAEIIWTKGNEPCLVEVGARLHGRNGTDIPILMRSQGYSIASATLDAYFNPSAFHLLPQIPSNLRAHGVKATLVSYDHGTLKDMPGLREIEMMASYVETRVESTSGVVVTPTIDAFTTPGTIAESAS
ncbi:hypothetical protein H310_13782 [Aphanomyces invadans]|uniref:ATP-grasp domain-containing protein n=1 Tax=Aphanomyces invadans TaxID=157072 RepID=A0A024TCD4_9STRA|nr:hypothetical protein H310_13782 [Aphanomyces invadans]ETV91713.1 hypothetical protein H310_13782 [Aphanomyces invadans]|eukprot:XP_008879639.1 hypothetical protein H310_13782 [Aphanomyces invadans]